MYFEHKNLHDISSLPNLVISVALGRQLWSRSSICWVIVKEDNHYNRTWIVLSPSILERMELSNWSHSKQTKLSINAMLRNSSYWLNRSSYGNYFQLNSVVMYICNQQLSNIFFSSFKGGRMFSRIRIFIGIFVPSAQDTVSCT